ncbi:MAG: hypothetical protein WAO23_08365 [Dethiobacteria bacterium]
MSLPEKSIADGPTSSNILGCRLDTLFRNKTAGHVNRGRQRRAGLFRSGDDGGTAVVKILRSRPLPLNYNKKGCAPSPPPCHSECPTCHSEPPTCHSERSEES